MITAYSTYSVNIPLYSVTFADNSWADIQAAVKAGLASSYWEVGDSKAVTLNGGVGSLTFSNETYYAFILGFDHNSLYEGTNKLHMCLGKNASGTQVAFIDSNFANDATSGFIMNTTDTNSGGWNNCYMRKTICLQFLNILSTDLQSVITACTKYSDNTGGGSNTASYVTETQDKIWLLAEYEVKGKRSYANSAEQNYQQQYSYYTNGNSAIRYQYDSPSTTCQWYLRSTAGQSFSFIMDSGSVYYTKANQSRGFVPCFVIG